MLRIVDKTIRRRLVVTLNHIRKTQGLGSAHLKDIESILSAAREIRNEAAQDKKTHLEPYYSAANLHISALSAFALAIVLEDESPLPRNWLNRNPDRNPNNILEGNIVQIVNHGIALLTLLECGLTNSARSLLRSVIEITWVTIIYCSLRDKAQVYAKGDNFSDAKNIWQQHFSPKSMKNSLAIIEKQLGMSADIIDFLKEHREHIYELHTQSAHNTSSVMAILAHDTDLKHENESDPPFPIALFGRVGIATKTTINDSIDVLGYVVMMLFMIFKAKHKYKTDVSKQDKTFWSQFQSIAIASQDVWFGNCGCLSVGHLWQNDNETK